MSCNFSARLLPRLVPPTEPVCGVSLEGDKRFSGFLIGCALGLESPFEGPVVDRRLGRLTPVDGTEGRPARLMRPAVEVLGGAFVDGVGPFLGPAPAIDDLESFVGDFVGDLKLREGAAVFAAGVGLPSLILLLFAVGSSTLGLLDPPTPITALDGRGFFAAPFPAAGALGAAFGFGASTTESATGRKNMPWLGAQSKYRCPCTAPSFLPSASESSTPTQSPEAKCVDPTYWTVPRRPFCNFTVWPISKSLMSAISHRHACHG